MQNRLDRKKESLIALPFAAVLALGAASYSLASTMVSWPAPAGAADASQSTDMWRVLFIAGGAEGRAPSGGGTWVPLAVGSILEPGSEIRTAAAAEVYLGSGEQTVNVEPNSRIELPLPKRAPATRVMQWFGEVIYEIGKGPPGHFEVDTPHLVAVVKGTKFSVTVDERGSAVDVSEGVVHVTAGRDKENGTDVTAGGNAAVSKSKPDNVSVSAGKSANAGATASGSSASSAKSSKESADGSANGTAEGKAKGTADGKANGAANGNGNGDGKGNGKGKGNDKGKGNGS